MSELKKNNVIYFWGKNAWHELFYPACSTYDWSISGRHRHERGIRDKAQWSKLDKKRRRAIGESCSLRYGSRVTRLCLSVGCGSMKEPRAITSHERNEEIVYRRYVYPLPRLCDFKGLLSERITFIATWLSPYINKTRTRCKGDPQKSGFPRELNEYD